MRTSLLGAILLALTIFAEPLAAQSALTGSVTSAEEGRMEGVLVSAKREGSNKIVTVVSNSEGAYSFPRNRLEPGRYDISIRAVGYMLSNTPSKMSASVTADATARLDLTLRKSNLDPTLTKGKEVKLYEVPFPWFFPYDAQYDEHGYTWTGGIYADRVARLQLDSGEWTFYLLPFQANIRDINLQPARDGGLSGLWIGHTHQGMITLVEPLAK